MPESTSTSEPTEATPAPIDPAPYRAFLHEGEQVLLVTRQHLWMLVDEILRAVVLVAVALGVVWFARANDHLDGSRAGDVLALVALVGAAIVLLRLGWTLLVWSRQRMVVTNEKVLYVSGVLNRNVESTPLVKIDDIAVEQPLLGRLLGFGKLLVDEPGGGKQPLYDLHYVADPAGAYRLISGLARRNRAWEGGADVTSAPPA
jgi:uncharacterized membrane protein YdbT with pleckstrin-like domain